MKRFSGFTWGRKADCHPTQVLGVSQKLGRWEKLSRTRETASHKHGLREHATILLHLKVETFSRHGNGCWGKAGDDMLR